MWIQMTYHQKKRRLNIFRPKPNFFILELLNSYRSEIYASLAVFLYIITLKKNFNIYFTSSLYFPTNWTINEKEIEFRCNHLCIVDNYAIFIYYSIVCEVSLRPPSY